MPAASPGAPVTRAIPVVAIMVVVLGAIVFIAVVGASARRGAVGPRLDVAALQNVSLAVTPAAMTSATHVPVGNNDYMAVPLSGSTFESIAFQWGRGGPLPRVFGSPRVRKVGETDQATFEACIQSAYGAPTSRSETDHVNRKHSSRWSLEGTGELRVDSVDVDIDLETFVPWRARGARGPGGQGYPGPRGRRR
jgi:hypothetical protein